ncbi:tRNA pseudouridine(13) synthase TruD [Pseudoxanthomonas spadix]|uniref:tRNA pseudouridine(13) synthase TruD n=1 Tax=Pseudoxanthomonas spadix TaxID=415229 RepID=UPI000EFF5CA1|nr:tRNA pseudouridine(13) synthase TruD [Pseudoxanthomonas spadix]MBP3973733.1 tRNA pseudouridine(13) synthase TruD [Pseudoxanthomonas spadix]RMW98065.1 tRNA pseudouridine(13) synthase TruD [Pseudoxanthomonas spadix]
MTETSLLPRAYGPSVLSAAFRSQPEDFQVVEIDSFAAHGEGEHLLLTLRKRGLNTSEVARRLAQWAGIGEVGIGYAGLKDRHAVTTQRFSVHLPRRVAPALAALAGGPLEIVDSAWHNRKLPRGALAGNRFTLVLRQVQGERSAIEARLQAIADRGLPNWFGEQRFGRGGGNVNQALAMFEGRRVRREQRSILLSAARSELFNRVLAARVADGSWERGLDGEVWMLAGSRSVFGPEPCSDTLARRLATFDIHPTGPQGGQGELRAQGVCAALELRVLSEADGPALRAGLEAAGLKQERRALRQQAVDLRWTWLDGQTLELGFALAPGSYATALLHELGPVREANRSA